MWRTSSPDFEDERTARNQILAFLDEYCRGMTLGDVREWYVDAFSEPFSATSHPELAP
jgi:hypothetical protein